MAVLATAGSDMDDDGYVSPEFDLPFGSEPDSEDESLADLRPAKRKKVSRTFQANKEGSGETATWEGVEDLAGDELERLAVAALGR